MTGGEKIFFKNNTDIGQNFLRDRSVAEWMAARARLGGGDRVLEIGPGEGILTRSILGAGCGALDAIELDTRLARFLEPLAASDARLALRWGDAVSFDYSSLPATPTHVIANLPYHITTPLIWRLLETYSGRGMGYMLLMVQSEAADRIASGAGARASNPLGVTLSAAGNAVIARKVPRGAFSPMPRVDSVIVEIKLSEDARGNAELPRDKIWRRLMSGSFAARRKTLANNWSGSFGVPKANSAEILASHGLPPSSRPEELALDEWLALHRDESLGKYIAGT
jgi:16S rRNA (adenine1518-N6/adenine1519-N6)-dimethyltransferase